MEFTPQQLSGAGRYNAKTRIGNWNEDLRLQEARLQDYKMRRASNQLLSSKMGEKISKANQKVSLSFSGNGLLHFGDTVLINHGQSGGALACDIWEETGARAGHKVVTVSPTTQPQARNTFIIISPSEVDGTAKSQSHRPLCYGDTFYLACNSALLVREGDTVLQPSLYLKSVLKTGDACSPISRQQAVFLAPGADRSGLWTLAKVSQGKHSGVERVLAEGEPVPAQPMPAKGLRNGFKSDGRGEATGNASSELSFEGAVVVQHVLTGQALFADTEVRQLTDFGEELEICAMRCRAAGRAHSLHKEASQGRLGETVLRQELENNHFYFVTAFSEAQSQEHRSALPPVATPASMRETILKSLRALANGFGLAWLRHELRSLPRMNRDSSEEIVDREDLRFALVDLHLGLSSEQLDQLMASYDKKNEGLIDMKQFMRSFGGLLSRTRQAAVDRLFTAICARGEGKVTLALMLDLVDLQASAPRGRTWNEEESRRCFAELWNVESLETMISPRKFNQFFEDISACYETDEDFLTMLGERWNLD